MRHESYVARQNKFIIRFNEQVRIRKKETLKFNFSATRTALYRTYALSDLATVI